MDYERFKEGFQDALKAELAVRGADVELTARRVDKMNESYDAITVRPTDSSIGVNISVEKAFAATDVVDFLWSQLVQLRIWSAQNAVFALLCA